jgi:hypothetical protein
VLLQVEELVAALHQLKEKHVEHSALQQRQAEVLEENNNMTAAIRSLQVPALRLHTAQAATAALYSKVATTRLSLQHPFA